MKRQLHETRYSALLLFVIMLVVSSCAQEPNTYDVPDQNIEFQNIPPQAVDSRIFREVSVLSVDTLGQESGRIGVARIDAGGNIYILHHEAHRIMKYDANGNFATQIGKSGDGPGEFGDVGGFDVSGDGRVFVTHGGRVLVFDEDGAFEFERRPGKSRSFPAVTSQNVVFADAFNESMFTAYSQALTDEIQFGRLTDDPLENSNYTIGNLDGYSDGIVLVTLMSSRILGYGPDGQQRFATRTIDAPELSQLHGRLGEGSVDGYSGQTMLINTTPSYTYVWSTAAIKTDIPPWPVDVYSNVDGSYAFSFMSTSDNCGARYIDEHQIIDACVDGFTIRRKVEFAAAS
jgi:hypothetical protein